MIWKRILKNAWLSLLGVGDEYETHLFLMNNRDLKVQFNAQLWNLHLDLCFEENN